MQAIIHVDGDAFFASCEVAQNERLRGKPVVTGEEKGIATAISYEAKKFGVTRGMLMGDIRKICPGIIIISSHYDLYKIFSCRMYAIVRRYAPIVEEYSKDVPIGDIWGIGPSTSKYRRDLPAFRYPLLGRNVLIFLDMRVIAHISDMHFGKIDTACIESILSAIKSANPNLIIISGDLTQRARVREYEQVASFIKRLEHPHLVIPGNHDIRPLYNPIARMTNAYDRYKKYISNVLELGYVDNEIAVASVNTVRSSALKDGRVNKRQIMSLVRWFRRFNSDRLKIVVTHHPFDLPLKWAKRKLARRADMAVHTLAEAGIDIYLSGHYHQSSVAQTAERYKIEDYAAVAIQAGTISNRQRKEVQSFNLIFINKPTVRVETYLYNADKEKFDLLSSKSFNKKGKRWQKEPV